MQNIRPLVRVEQSPEDPDGSLYFVAKGNPYAHPFTYSPHLEEEATNLEYLEEVSFFHEYDKEGRFAPKLDEIARSIPKKYRHKELAVEVVMEIGKIMRVNGFYKSPVRIYEILSADDED